MDATWTMLKADASFPPYPVHDGDELFANGIFELNVTPVLEHIAFLTSKKAYLTYVEYWNAKQKAEQ